MCFGVCVACSGVCVACSVCRLLSGAAGCCLASVCPSADHLHQPGSLQQRFYSFPLRLLSSCLQSKRAVGMEKLCGFLYNYHRCLNVL